MKHTIVFALGLALAGCASDEDLMNEAIDTARAHCEEQGKQFILKDQPKVETGELMDREVAVEGSCVGPGEPGYKPAKN